MVDSTIRRGGTGKDRTQFGAHTRTEAGAGLGGEQSAPAAAPEVPAARVEYDKARNARTTADELAVLAESKSDVVRLEVAQNPNASADTLRELATSGEDLLRDVARQNPAYEPGTIGERLGVAVTKLRRGEQPNRLIDA